MRSHILSPSALPITDESSQCSLVPIVAGEDRRTWVTAATTTSNADSIDPSTTTAAQQRRKTSTFPHSDDSHPHRHRNTHSVLYTTPHLVYVTVPFHMMRAERGLAIRTAMMRG